MTTRSIVNEARKLVRYCKAKGEGCANCEQHITVYPSNSDLEVDICLGNSPSLWELPPLDIPITDDAFRRYYADISGFCNMYRNSGPDREDRCEGCFFQNTYRPLATCRINCPWKAETDRNWLEGNDFLIDENGELSPNFE